MAEADGGRGDLVLKEGEQVKFPVEPDHPLARHQELAKVQSVYDIADFHFFKNMQQQHDAQKLAGGFATGMQASVVSPEMLAAWMATAGPPILRLTVQNLVVPAGSSVTFDQPLNRIDAEVVHITGSVISNGDLVINCREIGGD
jgi:hypothetical protein